jgi:hypothetical protein
MRHLVLCCLISGCAGFQAGVFVMSLLAVGRDRKPKARLAKAVLLGDSSNHVADHGSRIFRRSFKAGT